MHFTVLSCGEAVALCLNLTALIPLGRRIFSQYVCVAFRKQPDLDTGNSWSSSVSNLKLLVCVLLRVLRGLFCSHVNHTRVYVDLVSALSAVTDTSAGQFLSLAPCCALKTSWPRGVTWIPFLLLQDIHHFSQKNALSLQFEPVLLPTSTTNFTKIASFVCKGNSLNCRGVPLLCGLAGSVPQSRSSYRQQCKDTQWVLIL